MHPQALSLPSLGCTDLGVKTRIMRQPLQKRAKLTFCERTLDLIETSRLVLRAVW